LLGVIMFDIDHFKRVNDTYGHNNGDKVLRAVARAIMGTVRESDIPVRMGGKNLLFSSPGKMPRPQIKSPTG